MNLSRRKWLKRASGIIVPAMPFLLLPRKSVGQVFSFRDPAFMANVKPPSSAAYNATATTFDGTANFMTRGGDLTGSADSKLGSLSLWFNMSGGDGVEHIFYSNISKFIFFERKSTNKIYLQGSDSSGANIPLQLTSTNTFLSGSGWHHVLASWNSNPTAAYTLYVDDNNELNVGSSDNVALDWTRTNHSIGASTTGTTFFPGCLCEFWCIIGTAIDFTQASNRRKFDSAPGAGSHPVSLGADGSTPTGTAPIMYFKTLSSSIGTNAGTGGDFTGVGSFTSCTAP